MKNRTLLPMALLAVFSVVAVGCSADDDFKVVGTDPIGDGACSLRPCGGSYLGTWVVANTCALAVWDFGDNPACKDIPIEATIVKEGTMTFTESTEVSSIRNVQYDLSYTLPVACTAALALEYHAESVGEYCSRQPGCSWSASDGCACNLDLSAKDPFTPTTGPNPFEIRGNAMYFPNEHLYQEFCVEGDVLRLHQGGENGGFIIELTR